MNTNQDFSPVGTDLLPWLILAVGAALVFGNVLALFRPPPTPQAGRLERAPLVRSVLMIVVGLIGALWALATLVTG